MPKTPSEMPAATEAGIDAFNSSIWESFTGIGLVKKITSKNPQPVGPGKLKVVITPILSDALIDALNEKKQITAYCKNFIKKILFFTQPKASLGMNFSLRRV